MEIFEKFLESGNEINSGDLNGDTLLHEAVLTENRELFDVLCNQPDIDLNRQNQHGETALLLASQSTTTNYYALKLLELGANYKLSTHDNCTILHLTNDNRIIDRILQIDYDFIDLCNVRGETALHLACSEQHYTKLLQLLYYNADVMIRTVHKQLPLEYAIVNCNQSDVVEILMDFTCDQIEKSCDLRLFTKAMAYNSTILNQLIRITKHVKIDENDCLFFYNSLVCDCKQFELFIKKFYNDLLYENLIFIDDIVEILIRNLNDSDRILSNSQILLDYHLITDIIDYGDDLLQQIINKFISKHIDLRYLTKIICFYMSYGHDSTIEHLFQIYANYNYCELFKILLHMDFDCFVNYTCINNIMPYLIINIYLTVEELFEKYQLLLHEDLTFIHLLSYTALVKRYVRNYNGFDGLIKKKLEMLPNVPLLVELARNQCRIAFVKQFHIKTCCQFYTIVKTLLIPDRIRKIITFEIPLYGQQN